jgi:pimeloyl-ACP methyl ester carboxylesterase
VLRQSLSDRLEDTVAGLDVPVLVVVGEHDPLSGRQWRSALARPGGAPVVMPGLPHSAPNAAPERFARLVRACDAQLRGCNPSQGPDDSR